MKTTVVPAQITTVEDRIAGNFTFAQIVILIITLLIGTAIYAIAPPKLHFGITKFVFIGLQCLLLGGLAIRFQGKIIADWLVIYSRFLLRPRKYIFTKNDLIGREASFQLPKPKKVNQEKVKQKKATYESLAPLEETQINQLLEDPALTFSVKLAKKGGIDVSVKNVKS